MPANNEYEIRLDYEPGRDDLANSLAALAKIVEGHKVVANELLGMSGEEETTTTSIEMQNIERGSIKVLFKKIFKNKDGNVIEDPKLEDFINKATSTLTQYVNSNSELKKDNIDGIRNSLLDVYNAAGGNNPIVIESVKPEKIVRCLKALEVPSNLGEHQSVKATFLGETYDMNKGFHVDESKIERSYLERQTDYDQVLSIQVKKPDYVGNSKWTVVYNDKTIEAKILDEQWLQRFQNSELTPLEFPSPKDTVVVKADVTVEKKDGKEPGIELEIKEILRVNKYNKPVNIPLF